MSSTGLDAGGVKQPRYRAEDDVSQLRKSDYVEELERIKREVAAVRHPRLLSSENQLLTKNLPSVDHLRRRDSELRGPVGRFAKETEIVRDSLPDGLRENRKFNYPLIRHLARKWYPEDACVAENFRHGIAIRGETNCPSHWRDRVAKAKPTVFDDDITAQSQELHDKLFRATRVETIAARGPPTFMTTEMLAEVYEKTQRETVGSDTCEKPYLEGPFTLDEILSRGATYATCRFGVTQASGLRVHATIVHGTPPIRRIFV